MIKYGVNIDLFKRLIYKTILSKTDLLTDVDIELDDSGKKIFIFVTFHINASKLEKYKDEYKQKLIDQYGSIKDIPDEEYISFDDYFSNEVLYRPTYRLLFIGMGLPKEKYLLSIETLE